jgi:four helix bundle protein
VKYTDLIVWQKALDLVEEVYKLAKQFPPEERFGLSSQIQRAAVSIPANIAEGHGRKYTNAYLNHLSVALGSLMELETHLRIAQRLNYLAPATMDDLLIKTDEVGRMLGSLRASLSQNSG